MIRERSSRDEGLRPPRRPGFVALAALVARRDYVRAVRRRGFVFGTALLPIGLAAFVLLSDLVAQSGLQPGAPPGAGVDPGAVTLTIVNDSDLELSSTSGSPRIRVVSRAEGERDLQSTAIDELYVVPAGYPSAAIERIVRPGRGGAIDALQRRASQQERLTAVLRLALLERAGVPPETAAAAVAPVRITERTTTGAPSSGGFDAASFFVPYAFTLLFVMSIFITSGYLLQSVTEEKENRVVEIVLSSVPALPLMAGKILGLGAAGLTQVAIWIATALVALPLLGDRAAAVASIGSAISPLVILLALAYFALGYLCFGAIFSAVGALAPGSREAQQYAGFFGFFAVVPLIFTGIFLTDLESPIVLVLALIPLTAPAAMLQVLSLAPEPTWGLIAASLISLALFTALATVASARVFRATLLLYGVRPGIRQIVGAMFARG